MRSILEDRRGPRQRAGAPQGPLASFRGCLDGEGPKGKGGEHLARRPRTGADRAEASRGPASPAGRAGEKRRRSPTAPRGGGHPEVLSAGLGPAEPGRAKPAENKPAGGGRGGRQPPNTRGGVSAAWMRPPPRAAGRGEHRIPCRGAAGPPSGPAERSEAARAGGPPSAGGACDSACGRARGVVWCGVLGERRRRSAASGATRSGRADAAARTGQPRGRSGPPASRRGLGAAEAAGEPRARRRITASLERPGAAAGAAASVGARAHVGAQCRCRCGGGSAVAPKSIVSCVST